MSQIDELLNGKTKLSKEALKHLYDLELDWQLIADLSFADLAMWVETLSGEFIAVGQVRAATAATVFPRVFVGDQVSSLDQSDGIEYFPIGYNGEVIAKLARHRNPSATRSTGRLESAYQDIAQQLLDMVGESTFPFDFSISALNPSPRVGDGFIRLNSDGTVDYDFLDTKVYFNDNVYNILLQEDGKILISGDFDLLYNPKYSTVYDIGYLTNIKWHHIIN